MSATCPLCEQPLTTLEMGPGAAPVCPTPTCGMYRMGMGDLEHARETLRLLRLTCSVCGGTAPLGEMLVVCPTVTYCSRACVQEMGSRLNLEVED